MKNDTKRDLTIFGAVFAGVFALIKMLTGGKKNTVIGTGRIKKGDKVMYEGEKYSVEDVRPHTDGVNNIYTICRMASPDGVSLKLDCLKIGATEDELEKVK